jgi:predicted unusual protein kinase regulating ubiquinone biosynthesis (AarF/ABC1/UbiB family)
MGKKCTGSDSNLLAQYRNQIEGETLIMAQDIVKLIDRIKLQRQRTVEERQRDFYDLETHAGIFDLGDEIAIILTYFAEDYNSVSVSQLHNTIVQRVWERRDCRGDFEFVLVVGMSVISPESLSPNLLAAFYASMRSSILSSSEEQIRQYDKACASVFQSLGLQHDLLEMASSRGDWEFGDRFIELAQPAQVSVERFELRRNFFFGSWDKLSADSRADGNKNLNIMLGAAVSRDLSDFISEFRSKPNQRMELTGYLLDFIADQRKFRKTSFRKPSTIRRDRSSVDECRRLLAVCLKIESVVAAPNEIKEFPFDRFKADLNRIRRPEEKLFAATALMMAIRASNDAKSILRASVVYESLCVELSNCVHRDLLRVINSDVATKSQISLPATALSMGRVRRGAKGGVAAFKLIAATLLFKLENLVSLGRAGHETYQGLLMRFYRSMHVDVESLRGGIQKIAQLGSAVYRNMPYEARDLLRSHNIPQSRITGSRIEQLIEGSKVYVQQSFEMIDPAPLACGAIGQVHRARLTNGTDVCVKIKYPNIEKIVREDFSNLKLAVDFVRRLLPNQSIDEIVKQWEQRILEECDYQREFSNWKKLSPVLQGAGVVTPFHFADISSQDVLVMEFIEATRFDQFCRTADQSRRNRIGVKLWHSLYLSLSHGYFRTDIHPGNYLIKDDQLVYLDFGAIDQDEWLIGFNHFEFMSHIANRDVDSLTELFLEKSWTTLADNARQAARISVDVMGKPFLGDFEFTQDYVGDVFRAMTFKIGKLVSMPASHVQMVRVFWSLYSMLADLRATANWREILQQFWSEQKSNRTAS